MIALSRSTPGMVQRNRTALCHLFVLERAELALINMLSKTKKGFTTPPAVLCSVASYKLFYNTEWMLEPFHYYLCRQLKAAEWRLIWIY